MASQVGLLPAGCQPWNTDVCAASGNRFAYCATLAIYVYELDRKFNQFKLISIIAQHKKTISAIAWHPRDKNVFASCSYENKIIIWDVVRQKPLAYFENTKGTPVTIGWCNVNGEAISYMHGRGPLCIWSYLAPTSSTGISYVKDTGNFVSDVTCFRWHEKKNDKVVFGHKDGSVSFCVVGKKVQKHAFKPELDDDEDDSENAVTALEWDPLSTDYLLVSNTMSGIQLLDSVSVSIIMTFQLPSAAATVKTVSWVRSAPGTFITGDKLSGILRVWNVSKSTPIENVHLKNTGFHALQVVCDSHKDNNQTSDLETSSPMSSTSLTRSPSMINSAKFALPKAQLVCAFHDGGIGLYDLGRRKWDFIREQGHVETIFDCKYSPEDANILATGSFDGTVKLWDTRSFSCVNTSPGNEGIIYTISWAPVDLNCIVAGTSKSGMFIWDINKGRIIKRFNEHGKFAVYTVCWNQKDSRKIMSCGADGNCIIRQVNGEILHKYKHPAPVFGCDWCPHNKDMLATGCEDHNVRVFYTATNSDLPLKVFSGHMAKVFHVKWSPLKENLLCSGSDDCTMKVWDYSQEACICTLNGHGGPVRGLIWNTEIPYLLISGSWDSTIRVWDLRKEACLDTIKDHGADVYGLTCHPKRPFILASSSRDSTVRLWSLTRLLQPLEINIITGKPWAQILGTMEEAMDNQVCPILAGKVSRDLKIDADEFPKTFKKNILKSYSKMFMPPTGTDNLWELVSVIQGLDDTLLSENYSKGIIHVKHMLKFSASQAQHLEMSKLTKFGGGVGAPSKEERLREAASLYIKQGNIQRFCEIMVGLGEWEQALSVAPGVSMQYWKSLTKRYAKYLVSEDDDKATVYCSAIGEVSMMKDFLLSRGQLLDAVLAVQAACEGCFPDKKSLSGVNEQGLCNGVNGSTQKYELLLRQTIDSLAESYFVNGSPVLSACCFLAVDDTKRAISRLIQGNELELAAAMGTVLGDLPDYTSVALEYLSRRCERLGKWELAIDLLNLIPDNQLLLSKCCSRWSIREDLNLMHQKANLPSLEDCFVEGEKLKRKVNTFECVMWYLLSASPEIGLELGLDDVTNEMILMSANNLGFVDSIEMSARGICLALWMGFFFKADILYDIYRSTLKSGDWKVEDVFSLLQLLGSIRTEVIQVHRKKNALLAVSSYVGALVAIRRRYHSIVHPLFQHARTLLQKDSYLDIGVAETQIQIESTAWNVVYNTQNSGPVNIDAISPEYRETYVKLITRAGSETKSVHQGPDCIANSHLPSHSDVRISCLTGERIQGLAYFLEDGQSAISPNEALMWAKVNPFSPLGTGYRINPF